MKFFEEEFFKESCMFNKDFKFFNWRCFIFFPQPRISKNRTTWEWNFQTFLLKNNPFISLSLSLWILMWKIIRNEYRSSLHQDQRVELFLLLPLDFEHHHYQEEVFLLSFLHALSILFLDSEWNWSLSISNTQNRFLLAIMKETKPESKKGRNKKYQWFLESNGQGLNWVLSLSEDVQSTLQNTKTTSFNT